MKEEFQNVKEPDFDLEFDELIEDETSADIAVNVQNSSSGGTATKAGIQKQTLQEAMDNYAYELNKSAIAKSTGLPVRTPSDQYKGFAAEEYFKETLKINALAKGKSLEVITQGTLPDGSTLSGIDMETDISVWKKTLSGKSVKIADYQSKIHNNPADYAKDMTNQQYENVEFVGGSGQRVNDKVRVNLGKKEITSDSLTPEEATKLADSMKSQDAPSYDKAAEKHAELNRVNLANAVKTGAATGLIVSTTKEIISVIRNRDNLTEDQFIDSVKNIMIGTADGGVRSGAIMGSVQLLSKVAGKEIAANSLGAIPAMVAANTAVDLAKDLYRCFVTQSIDADDLLCNTINNVYNSAAGFGGAYVGGQIAVFATAKTAAATGATIGSTLGPVGTVIGSVIGGIVIGMGASAVVNVANKDAQTAFAASINKINSNLEASGVEKLYYFADEISSISDFKLSFKTLLPCYNLISDMKEYNLRKKAIKNIYEQMENSFSAIDDAKQQEMDKLIQFHQDRINELHDKFKEQRQIMFSDLNSSLNTYVSNSYEQYLSIASVNNIRIDDLNSEIDENSFLYNNLIYGLYYRNEVNSQLNETLRAIVEGSESKKTFKPFTEKIQWFMQQDDLLISRQYISLEESLNLIGGGN